MKDMKTLDGELAIGKRVATAMVEHLQAMGATSLAIPVTLDGRTFSVEVTELSTGTGWIDWSGEGEVPTAEKICVRHRSGVEYRVLKGLDTVGAEGLLWKHNGNAWDIVAYKVLS